MISEHPDRGSAQEVRVYFEEKSTASLRLTAILPTVGDRIVTPDEAGEPRMHVVRAVTAAEDGSAEIRVGFGFPCPQALMATYRVGAADMMRSVCDETERRHQIRSEKV